MKNAFEMKLLCALYRLIICQILSEVVIKVLILVIKIHEDRKLGL